MKTTIYYFSGTGNSLKIAQDLATKLGDTEVVSISSVIKENIPVVVSSEKIGIVYPVYIWGIPKIVSQFIKNIEPTCKDKYFFAIATMGGRLAGSLLRLSNELSSRGFKLSLGYSITMPTNYTHKHGADSIEKQKALFDAGEKRLNEIASLIKNNKVTDIERGPFKDRLIRTGIIYRLASPFIHKIDKYFWTTNDCNSCGLCEKICPVQNIVLKNGKPVWLHKCEQCFRCLHYCPKASIQFAKNTEGKNRYKNPFINLNELIKD